MKTKICSKCKIEKELNHFHKDKSTYDGYYPSCKNCRYKIYRKYLKLHYKELILKNKLYRNKNRVHINNLKRKYYLKNKDKINEKRKNFPWKNTLHYIKQRCNNPNNNRYYCYGGRGIKCLITEEELKKLWYRDKAFEMNKPSIDRINNDGDYTFENCRFIELSENIRKMAKKVNSKSVLQYDLDGNFIREWESMASIERQLNYSHQSISKACNSINNIFKNFKWVLKPENYQE